MATTELDIYEGAKSDISTVYAYRTSDGKGESYTCFNGTYKVGHEREYIAWLDAANPGRYSSYKIYWSNCN